MLATLRSKVVAAAALATAAAFPLASPASASPTAHASHSYHSGHDRQAGLVFQNTNPAGANAVQVYTVAADGALRVGRLFPTGGTGTGASLGDQGGVVREGNRLFVVNAGDNTVSLFRITGTGLALVGVTPSGGTTPVSVTVHDSTVFVLNAGSQTISGFRLGRFDRLTAIPHSTRTLAGTAVGAAEIKFTTRGDRLIVSEKAANTLVTFRVDRFGRPDAGTATPSVGAVPFGFDIDARDHVIVSEAAPSALSSYRVAGTRLRTITAGLSDTQAAACWVEVTRNGKFAYTTNGQSGTISSYRIHPNGSLSLLSAVAATTAAGPTDMAESENGHFLFVRVRSGAIESYRIGSNGSLTLVNTAQGAPAFGISGLAAR